MTETPLPPALQTALSRLERAVQTKADVAATAAKSAQQGAQDAAALQERLAAAESETATLRKTLAEHESRRAQALKQVDSAVGRIDDLLTAADAGSE